MHPTPTPEPGSSGSDCLGTRVRAAAGASLPVSVSAAVTPGGASAAYAVLILITLAIAAMGAFALRKMGGEVPSFFAPGAARKQAQTATGLSAPAATRNPINAEDSASHVESWGASAPGM